MDLNCQVLRPCQGHDSEKGFQNDIQLKIIQYQCLSRLTKSNSNVNLIGVVWCEGKFLTFQQFFPQRGLGRVRREGQARHTLCNKSQSPFLFLISPRWTKETYQTLFWKEGHDIDRKEVKISKSVQGKYHRQGVKSANMISS